MVEVPSFPTTTPAPAFASTAASRMGMRAATASASTESTVSPAPVTSNTWRPCAAWSTASLSHARVADLAAGRGNVKTLRRCVFKHVQPFGATRDHHGRTAKMRQQSAARLPDGFVVLERTSDEETRFLGVADDHGRASIGKQSRSLRLDQHRDAAAVAFRQHAIRQRIGHHAFVVIRDDQRVQTARAPL